MDNINLIESFTELKDVKNIDKSEITSLMQDVFRTIIAKKYGSSDNFTIIVNPTKGDLEIWRNREIVSDDFEEFDENVHLKLADAKKIEADFEIGEEYSDEMKISDFGRRSISTIKQVLKSKIMDLGKESLYRKYIDRVGELIVGDVHQILRKEVILLDEDGVEMILPKTEQIFSDFFRKGDSVRAVISAVEIKNNNIQVILSRVSNNFLERLFEVEIPEVFDGLIIVKDIVREPGVKAKVSVESYDDRIDSVGTCVGVKGSRIHTIVRELNNEYIDVINYTTNKSLYVMRALGQGKANIEMNDDRKIANVVVAQSELAKAIGKSGLNIKLASKLTGYKINICSDQQASEEDVSLDDFSDEIDGWIIDELEKIGCDTAKSVLRLSFKELVDKTDLEEETVREIIKILEAEFK